MKKEYTIIISMGLILSFLIGFIINSTFFGSTRTDIEIEHHSIEGDRQNIIGKWQGWQGSHQVITINIDGTITFSNSNSEGNWSIINERLVIDDPYGAKNFDFYFLDDYDTMVWEVADGFNIVGYILYRIQ